MIRAAKAALIHCEAYVQVRLLFVGDIYARNWLAAADRAHGADQTVYLVGDSFCASGAVYRETEIERADFETIIAEFLTGHGFGIWSGSARLPWLRKAPHPPGAAPKAPMRA